MSYILDINKNSLPEQVQENKDNIEILMQRNPETSELIKRIALANDFDEFLTYNVGDLAWIIDDETYYLYKCISAITTPAPLDLNEWNKVSLKDLLDEKQDIITSDVIPDGTIAKNIGFDIDGNIVKATPSSVSLETITDSNGHLRFIEDLGSGNPNGIAGLTISYCKWSLSGTHIMFVVAGSVASGTTLSDGNVLATFDIPAWIYDKIVPVWSNRYLYMGKTLMVNNNWSTQDMTYSVGKYDDIITIYNSANVTLSAARSFRIQFDLLIDTD